MKNEPKAKNFDKNIFINCPFDSEYKPILRAIIFVIIYLGYKPRIALESVDSGLERINKIKQLIKESKLSIHDISRIQSSRKNEFYRLNMAFELGLDMGARTYGTNQPSEKNFLVLEKHEHDYKKALSDFNGFDILSHANNPSLAIERVREWLVSTENLKKVVSPKVLWREFTTNFLTHLFLESGFEEDDIDKMPIVEFIEHLNDWKTKSNIRNPT